MVGNDLGGRPKVAQGLSGGKQCRRTPCGFLARKNAKIPEVVKVNNDQKMYLFNQLKCGNNIICSYSILYRVFEV
jgi:hypothetical protein